MKIEKIDKWLDDKYGISYTELVKIKEYLAEENERLREIIKDYEQPLIFLKNRINQGMSQKVQNESAIRYVQGRLNILRGDKE